MKMEHGDKGTRWLAVSVLLLMAAVSAGCVKAVCGPLLLAEEPLHPADAVVVLGYGPPLGEDGKPVPEIVRRAARGAEVFKMGLAPAMIVTGGFTGSVKSEAQVMKEIVVGLGVPAEAVILEEKAQDTIGNARYSAEIMRERGWKTAILVSSPYHLKRGRMLFEKAGIEVQTTASAAPESAAYAVGACLHEYTAAFEYFFTDLDKRLRGEGEEKP